MGCGCEKSEVELLADKVKSIAKGWAGVIWSSREVKEIAHKRIKICAECDENNHNLCRECGCWIPAKARSMDEKCHKWDSL